MLIYAYWHREYLALQVCGFTATYEAAEYSRVNRAI